MFSEQYILRKKELLIINLSYMQKVKKWAPLIMAAFTILLCAPYEWWICTY